MRCRQIFLCLLLLLIAGGANADGPSVTASRVWIPEAPPGVEIMAGYMTLTNQTDQVLTLDKVTSPDFSDVTLHQTLQQKGMDSMQAVKPLPIPAHNSVVLAPSGYHLMLMHPVKPLYGGDFVTLTLTFSDQSSLTIMAPVRRDAPQS